MGPSQDALLIQCISSVLVTYNSKSVEYVYVYILNATIQKNTATQSDESHDARKYY